MAGATSYIHVALEVDLGQLDRDIVEYTQGISFLRIIINQTLHSQHFITNGFGTQIDIRDRI